MDIMTRTPFMRFTEKLSLNPYEGDDNTEDILEWLWRTKETIFEGSLALESSGKSEDRANTLRNNGNDYYKRRNYEKALELYNLSIMASPHPVLNDDTSFLIGTSDEDDRYMFPRIDPSRYGGVAKGESKCLAKGFANRSAIMFELNLYGKCLQDIELAVEYGYPKELLTKLEGRKLRCITLQQAVLSDEEKTTIPKEPDAGSDTHVSDELTCINSSSISNSMAALQLEKKKNMSLKDSLTAKRMKPPVLVDVNPEMPCVSTAVKVSYIELRRRGIVAVRDIHPGEVLGVERAYVTGIRKESLATCCYTCLCICLNPLPCPGCSKVIFCSKTCRTRGLAEDHWLECKIISSVISNGMYNKAATFLLLKTFTCQQLKTMINEFQDIKTGPPEHRGFSSDGVYVSTSYQSVYHLFPEAVDCSFEDLLFKSHISFFITKFLELSGRYFVDAQGEPVKPTKEDFLDTCKLLIINGIKRARNGYVCAEKEGGCWGMFPALSLVNHSCDPSAVVDSTGRDSFLIALRPIAAGEEVTITYTGHYQLLEMEKRMELLKTYHFVCNCVACECYWPTFTDLPPICFKCLYCSVPVAGRTFVCPPCTVLEQGGHLSERVALRHLQAKRIDLALVQIGEVSEKIARKKPTTKDDFDVMCEAIEGIHDHVVMPGKLIFSMQDVMMNCFRQGLDKID